MPIAKGRAIGSWYTTKRMAHTMETLARRQGCSMSELLRQAVWNYAESLDYTGFMLGKDKDVILSRKKRHIKRKDLKDASTYKRRR